MLSSVVISVEMFLQVQIQPSPMDHALIYQVNIHRANIRHVSIEEAMHLQVHTQRVPIDLATVKHVHASSSASQTHEH